MKLYQKWVVAAIVFALLLAVAHEMQAQNKGIIIGPGGSGTGTTSEGFAFAYTLDSLNTTDGTPDTIFTFTAYQDTNYVVDAFIYGIRTGGTAGNPGDQFNKRLNYKYINVRDTLYDLQADGGTKEDVVGGGLTDAYFIVEGTDVKLVVRGVVDYDFSWYSQVLVTKVPYKEYATIGTGGAAGGYGSDYQAVDQFETINDTLWFQLRNDGQPPHFAVVGGSIGAGSIGGTELMSTPVAAGSYTNTDLTVDEDGRITAASNGSAALPSTDDQALTRSNDTIYLEDGGFVVLPDTTHTVNTDDQALTRSNDTIYLEDGGFVVLPDTSLAPKYFTNYIPFGDNSTLGGTTSIQFQYDETLNKLTLNSGTVDATMVLDAGGGGGDEAQLILTRGGLFDWMLMTGSAPANDLFLSGDGEDFIQFDGNAPSIIFEKQAYFGTATLTDAASITWDLEAAQTAKVTLTANRTLANPTNKKDGGHYAIRIIQDGTGSRTLTFGANYKFPGGTAPTLSTGASDVDIMTCVSDGTNMYCNLLNDFN